MTIPGIGFWRVFNPIPSTSGFDRWKFLEVGTPPLNLLDDDFSCFFLYLKKMAKIGVTNPPRKDGGRLDFQGKTPEQPKCWKNCCKFTSTQWLDGPIVPISYVEVHIETQPWNKQLLQLNVFVAFQLSVFWIITNKEYLEFRHSDFLLLFCLNKFVHRSDPKTHIIFEWAKHLSKPTKKQTRKTIPRNPHIILRKGFCISSYSGDGIGTLKSNSIGMCLDS